MRLWRDARRAGRPTYGRARRLGRSSARALRLIGVSGRVVLPEQPGLSARGRVGVNHASLSRPVERADGALDCAVGLGPFLGVNRIVDRVQRFAERKLRAYVRIGLLRMRRFWLWRRYLMAAALLATLAPFAESGSSYQPIGVCLASRHICEILRRVAVIAALASACR